VANDARTTTKPAGAATGAAGGKALRKALKQPLVTRPTEAPDALGSGQMKALLLRLAIPLVGVWVIGLLVAAVTQSTAVRTTAIVLPLLITLALAGLVFWALRQAKKARGVAGILSNVETAEDRKAALEQLETSYKKNDPAAIFARAQLELQEDPRKALATLEKINLEKVMAPMADEARGQRAMIHLMLGEVSPARQLVDGIDLKRHQEPKARAMLAAITAEAWARSGQAKKGLELLELYDAEDQTYQQLAPQLYRAQAFASAYASDSKTMKKALRKLLDMDARLLGGFMLKKTHPLLQKEARRLLEQSGAVPRKMMIQRR
jgi:hypothetical protein